MRETAATGGAGIVYALTLAVTIVTVLCVGCAHGSKPLAEKNEVPSKTIRQVLEEHTDEWMSIPGVVGTAIGKHRGKPCIRVLVDKRTKELASRIPREIDGFAVTITESGELRALDAP